MTDVYLTIPVLSNGCVTLRPVEEGDLEGLLRCYSDEKAVPLFNSDNCHGDNFHYTTPERMKQAMDFWNFSYREKYFVRWTVLASDKIAGTVEMFRRESDDIDAGCGVLRVDLASSFECADVLGDILEIVRRDFYALFDTDAILTKAVPSARQRIEALTGAGYSPLGRQFAGFDHYYRRNRPNQTRFL